MQYNTIVVEDKSLIYLQFRILISIFEYIFEYICVKLMVGCVCMRRDGNGAGQICHTQFDQQAWWEVDLGEMAILEEIKVPPVYC